MDDCDDLTCLERVYAHTIQLLQKQSISVLPDLSTLKASRSSLLQRLPEHGGLGLEKTTDHLLRDIAPALNGSSLSPKYYGFVTGGVTPAARVADVLVSTYDQNPQMHLPDQTIASNVEDRALRLLMEVLRFEPSAWSGVFSTGATASNILGLACGREHLLNNRLKDRLGSNTKETIGSLGLLRGCRLAEVDEIHIYTTLAHSSLYKASSILGLGHSCIKHVGKSDNDLGLDMTKLEQQLELDWQNKVSIVVISCGEVNTGLFATHGYDELKALRRVCDKYGAWLHVDGAFGIFARVLDGSPGFETVKRGTEGLELADSIAGDGHKLLNVPYDCGFFFCRHPSVSQHVFRNPNVAYLSTGSTSTDTIQSPLNVGIENSRRFRGLPVYTTLVAYGRDGYADMLKRQVQFARAVAIHIFHHAAFELLPQDVFHCEDQIRENIFIIVLFSAKNKTMNNDLVKTINASGEMYVSATVWDGQPACRIAVSNWGVNVDCDLNIVKEVLEYTVSEWSNEMAGS